MGTSFIKFHVTYFLTVIRIGEGPACPDGVSGASDEILQAYMLRNYELFKDLNISNGWCSVGKGKQIIPGSIIGKQKDICICSPLSNIGSNSFLSTTASPKISSSPSTVEICPDFVVEPSNTRIEVSSYYLQRDGPSNGVCADKNKILWVIDGSVANLLSKCVCVERPNLPGQFFQTK